MKLIPFPTELRTAIGFSHKVIVGYADLTVLGAGNSVTFQIFPDVGPPVAGTQPLNPALPSGTCIARTGFQLVTPLAGGALSAAALALGDLGNTARYMNVTQTNLFTAAANTKNAVVSNNAYVYTQADVAGGVAGALVMVLQLTGATFAELTAGRFEVYFNLQMWDRLPFIGEPG